MKQSLVQSTAMVSNAYLKDFDWKVKVKERDILNFWIALRLFNSFSL